MAHNYVPINYLDKSIERPLQWVSEFLKIGVYRQADLSNYTDNCLELYIDTVNGSDYNNGGKGTQTDPFDSIQSAIQVINDFNIRKNICFNFLNSNVDILNVITLPGFNYIKLKDAQLKIKFDVSQAGNTFYSSILFTNSKLIELDNIMISLMNIQNGSGTGLDSIIRVENSTMTINNCNISNYDGAYSIDNILLSNMSDVYILDNVIIESVDNTTGNAPSKNGIYLINSNLYGSRLSTLYAREYGFIVKDSRLWTGMPTLIQCGVDNFQSIGSSIITQ